MNDTSLIVVAIGAMILRPRIVGLQDQSRAIAQLHLSTVPVVYVHKRAARRRARNQLFTNRRRVAPPAPFQP
jgi:hypothetical protein